MKNTVKRFLSTAIACVLLLSFPCVGSFAADTISVESIEIVSLPDDVDYVYGIDGWANGYFDGIRYQRRFMPDVHFEGMVLAIHYTDNTSKSVLIDTSGAGEYWQYVLDDETRVEIFLNGEILRPGTYSLTVDYMGQTDEFDINITKPGFFQMFVVEYNYLFALLEDIFSFG